MCEHHIRLNTRQLTIKSPVLFNPSITQAAKNSYPVTRFICLNSHYLFTAASSSITAEHYSFAVAGYKFYPITC
jgi:hypothetical protein